MKLASRFMVVMVLGLLVVSASAKVAQIKVAKGTEVILAFDQAVSSKTAKVGQSVALHVQNSVKSGGYTVLPAGTKVTGTLSQVDKRKRFGVNAKIRIVLNPVRSAYGGMITLDPRSEGKYVGGKKSGQAAGATAGGAILLGPVGLVGGYFISGKPVTIKVGDQLATQVASTAILKIK